VAAEMERYQRLYRKDEPIRITCLDGLFFLEIVEFLLNFHQNLELVHSALYLEQVVVQVDQHTVEWLYITCD
jgi:hypothetical protein